MDHAKLLAEYDIYGATLTPYGNGHINSTFLVDNGKKYVLQKINTNVFPEPERLMESIKLVTDHIRAKLSDIGEDTERGTLSIARTKDGRLCTFTDDGECYRVLNFIDGISHDNADDVTLLYRAAKAYGKFQKLLSDFPAEKLFEVIPDFHNTPKRFKTFEKSLAENKSGRADTAKEEIDFVLSMKNEISYVTDGIADGSIPLRVTHNDTKLNNFLFDRDSGECLCLIDLDTIMPGSLLYDFGDALRVGASSAAEDEADLDKVHFRPEAFEQFARGFLESAKNDLSKREIELLPYSEMLLTFECGMRFLTDYIDGDTYFKTAYPEHNLVRARNQFALVREIKEKLPELNALVSRLIEEIK